MAKRIQRRRTKGYRMPEGAIYVGRPSRWGNPFRIERGRDAHAAKLKFVSYMMKMRREEPERYNALLEPLRGKDLACWCPDGAFCHADTLLALVKEIE